MKTRPTQVQTKVISRRSTVTAPTSSIKVPVRPAPTPPSNYARTGANMPVGIKPPSVNLALIHLPTLKRRFKRAADQKVIDERYNTPDAQADRQAAADERQQKRIEERAENGGQLPETSDTVLDETSAGALVSGVKKVPGWVWLAGGGVAFYLLFLRK